MSESRHWSIMVIIAFLCQYHFPKMVHWSSITHHRNHWTPVVVLDNTGGTTYIASFVHHGHDVVLRHTVHARSLQACENIARGGHVIFRFDSSTKVPRWIREKSDTVGVLLDRYSDKKNYLRYLVCLPHLSFSFIHSPTTLLKNGLSLTVLQIACTTETGFTPWNVRESIYLPIALIKVYNPDPKKRQTTKTLIIPIVPCT